MGKLPIEKKHGGLKSFAGTIISLLVRRRSSAQLVSLLRRQDTEQHGLQIKVAGTIISLLVRRRSSAQLVSLLRRQDTEQYGTQ